MKKQKQEVSLPKKEQRLIKSLIGKNVIRTIKRRDGSTYTKTFKIVEVKERSYIGMGLDFVTQPETRTWSVKCHLLNEEGEVAIGYRHKPTTMNIDLGHEIPLLKENVISAMVRYNSFFQTIIK
jgi:hypothetical protein